MQTAMIRLYGDPACSHLEIEAPISRAEAMEEIRAGFRAARERDLNREARGDDNVRMRSRCLQWSGYEPYQAAAPLDKQHVTRVRLRPAVGGFRDEYVFPGGLTTVECDDLCRRVVGESGADLVDREREWLVTGALAGVLHADGVSLAHYAIAVACGKDALVDGLVIVPTGPPATLHAAVRVRGWSATVEWLRDIQAKLDQGLDSIRAGRAVWVPPCAPRLPWEPLVLRPVDGGGCLRLALGAEAAAYAGRAWNSRCRKPIAMVGCPTGRRHVWPACRTGSGGDGSRPTARCGSAGPSPATGGRPGTAG